MFNPFPTQAQYFVKEESSLSECFLPLAVDQVLF
jgi:hypothetical protein